MGKELKRVPFDFDWPLKQVWEGFLNPYLELSQDCLSCKRSGWSNYAQSLHDRWYGNTWFEPSMTGSKVLEPGDLFVLEVIRPKVERSADFYRDWFGGVSLGMAVAMEAQRMCLHWNAAWCYHLDANDVKALVDGDRLWDFTRRPLSPEQETFQNGWTKEWNGYTPTPEEVNRWSVSHVGHDAINAHVCVLAKCKRNNQPDICDACGGDGHFWLSESDKALYEAWEPVEPPNGDGWQVWGTVSDGDRLARFLPQSTNCKTG